MLPHRYLVYRTKGLSAEEDGPVIAALNRTPLKIINYTEPITRSFAAYKLSVEIRAVMGVSFRVTHATFLM